MLSTLILLTCLGQLSAGGSTELELPKPHYHQLPGDPPWLVQTVQFHGHLGPSVIAGARFGMAGLRAVGAHGYFDVEVTCEGPFAKTPKSCFLDGLQVATGATLGKRSLNWVSADQILVRVKNTHTGKTVELRPSVGLLELLGWSNPQAKKVEPKQEEHKHSDEAVVEALARKIAAMPDAEIVALHLNGE